MKSLHTLIKKELKSVTNLDQTSKIVLSMLKDLKDSKESRIGYVAGVVTSDGPEKIDENVRNLINCTKNIRKQYNFPIFSSTDIFDKKFIENLDEMSLPPKIFEERFLYFWEKILESGYVTDIFLTPGWERSRGAKFEHNIANNKRLEIHYYKSLKGGEKNV